MAASHSSPSLRKQLFRWVVWPVGLTLLGSTLLLYQLTLYQARLPHDRALLDIALTLEEHVVCKDSACQIKLSPRTEALLLHDTHKRISFALLDAQARVIQGQADMPLPPQRSKLTQAQFYDANLGGEAVRALALPVDEAEDEFEDGSGNESGSKTRHQRILIVAETTQTRELERNEALLSLVLPTALLLGLMMLWLFWALRRALKPLERTRSELSTRHANALTPLQAHDVPAEVVPLVEEINALLERLQHAQQAQRRFIDDAAHQLRTPLTSLHTYAELALRDQPDAEKLHRDLQGLRQASARACRLLNQWLELARLEPELANLHRKPLYLDKIIREHGAEWLRRAEQMELNLEFQVEKAEVWGDAFWLGEMLANLVDNALRYTPQGGRIAIHVHNLAHAVEFRVEDSGRGILPADRERIFARFERLAQTQEGGSGLGLSIVQRVAEQHQISIVVEDSPTLGGACFRLLFPDNSSIHTPRA